MIIKLNMALDIFVLEIQEARKGVRFLIVIFGF